MWRFLLLLLGGAAFLNLLLVELSPPSLLFGRVAFLPLLWVVLCFHLSPFWWCCFPPCALWAGAVLLYGEPAPLPKSGGRQHDQKGRGGRQHHQKKEEANRREGQSSRTQRREGRQHHPRGKVNFPLVLLLFGSCAASLLLLWVTLPSSASLGWRHRAFYFD